MLFSASKKVGPLSVPFFLGEIKMLPFNVLDIYNSDIPKNLQPAVEAMCSRLPDKEITAYLTVDGREIDAGKSHRRGGVHIDGNYLADLCGWGGTPGSGWKVGGDGRELTKEQHDRSYKTLTGGIILASSRFGAKGWNGCVPGEARAGGDCSHLNLSRFKEFNLQPNTVYMGTSQWLHESVPITDPYHRTLMRVTLPEDYQQMVPLLKHTAIDRYWLHDQACGVVPKADHKIDWVFVRNDGWSIGCSDEGFLSCKALWADQWVEVIKL